MSQTPTQAAPESATPISKAPALGNQPEQWVTNMDFACVHCKQVFKTRPELLRHYESTRHDKYSAWK